MLFKPKASARTQGATAAGGSGSEKKRKGQGQGPKDFTKPLKYGGYAGVVVFMAVSVLQTINAFSNVNMAHIAYAENEAKLREIEEQRAIHAVENEIGRPVTVGNDGVVTQNNGSTTQDGTLSDSRPVDVGTNINNGGNDIVDNVSAEPDNDTVYNVCTACSKCGAMIKENNKNSKKCPTCGSKRYRYVAYKVKKGDTLSEISGKVGASVRSIANLNEIENVNLIYAGESLRIPD